MKVLTARIEVKKTTVKKRSFPRIKRCSLYGKQQIKVGISLRWRMTNVKCKNAYPTGAPGPCSRFLVESELFICFCYFVCIILITLWTLLYMSVFHVWSLFLDYILLITSRILVPLITLELIDKNRQKNGYVETQQMELHII